MMIALLVTALLLVAHHPAAAAAKKPKQEKEAAAAAAIAPNATDSAEAGAASNPAPIDETKPGEPPPKQDRKERPRKGKDGRKAPVGSQGASAPDDPKPAREAKKPIDFPVPVGRDAKGLHIRNYYEDNQLQMVLDIDKAHRLSEAEVELSAAKLATYTEEGGDDLGIDMAASLYNIETRILTSEEPVTIRRRDFEVTGAHFTFDTQTKKADFTGPVRMLVYSSPRLLPKSDAAPETPAKTPPDAPAPAGKKNLPHAP